MVDIAVAYDTFEIRDDQTQKEVQLFSGLAAVAAVKTFKVYPVSTTGAENAGTGTTKRIFDVVMEYETGATITGIFLRVDKVTTTDVSVQTLVDTTNNARVTLIALEAIPISQRNGNIDYILFFLSGNGADGTLYNIFSQRVPVTSGTTDNGITIDTGANNLEYTTSALVQRSQDISYYDIFNATST